MSSIRIKRRIKQKKTSPVIPPITIERAAYDLEVFRRTHTIKDDCKHCRGEGYEGRVSAGVQKNRYLGCRCAKKNGNMPVGKIDIMNVRHDL